MVGNASASNFRVLHNFGKGSDGANPTANLINVNGTFYGTTLRGGPNGCLPPGIGCGTVFSLSPSGTESVLYNFSEQSDGHWPRADLIDVRGTLYGTTLNGGAYNLGTVFRVTTTGTETVLYSFHGKPDGAVPYAGLIDVKGALYGTTFNGGAHNGGTVFRVSTKGKETVLYSFHGKPDGAFPEAGLVNLNGTLYGTTCFGGVHKAGAVFRISTNGTEQVLHSFSTNHSDGYNPEAGLVELNGILYGTTLNGGKYQNASNGGGTVFSITTTGSESVLHSFSSNPDGASPEAALIAVKGTLYGTTTLGGTYSTGGTVFSVSTTGVETVLYSFTSNGQPINYSGSNPAASLIDVNGILYGTAVAGGAHGGGTVFGLPLSGSDVNTLSLEFRELPSEALAADLERYPSFGE
jgi:uncharacterized repeat protein (TIGR03803 family)